MKIKNVLSISLAHCHTVAQSHPVSDHLNSGSAHHGSKYRPWATARASSGTAFLITSWLLRGGFLFLLQTFSFGYQCRLPSVTCEPGLITHQWYATHWAITWSFRYTRACLWVLACSTFNRGPGSLTISSLGNK